MFDIVYTWANTAGAYSAEEIRQLAGMELEGWLYENYATDQLIDQRFADHGELKYSLRSLAKYADWFDRIFIVHPDGQLPEWLNTEHPKIFTVAHSEIIPAEYLPTFNSSAIEFYLHRIPDLSTWFIYSNDDVFFNNYVTPVDFYTENGLAKGLFSKYKCPPASTDIFLTAHSFMRRLNLVLQTGMGHLLFQDEKHFLTQKAIWLGGLSTAQKAIEKLKPQFKGKVSRRILTDRRLVAHFHHVLNIDVMNYIHENLAEDIHRTSSQKFRTPSSICSIQLVVQLANIMGKHCENTCIRGQMGFSITDEQLGCINSGNKENIIAFFESKFPDRSCLEKKSPTLTLAGNLKHKIQTL